MRTITVVFLAFSASPLLAQEDMYVGVGLGRFDFEESMIDPVIGNRSDTVSSYKIYGGFEFNEHIAAEITYGTTDDVEARVTGNDPFLGAFTSTTRTEFTTTTIRAVGQLPRDWGVLIGGLGYFDTDADIELDFVSDAGSFTADGSISDDGMMAMLGIEWRFGRFGTGYGIRLEYEWRDIEDGDASTIGIGVSYRF